MTNVDTQKDSFFPSLRVIRLKNMQNVKSICKKSLRFLALKQVYVENCPNLEKLRFEVNSAPLLEILYLDECTKMEELIAVEEWEKTSAAPQLFL